MHIETIGYQVTQPSTGAPGVAVTGDSLIIKNCTGPASVIAMWAHNQVKGFHQLTFPSAHDTTRGFRTVISAADVTSRLPLGTPLVVQPQELVTVSVAGSNVSGDIETGCLLVHYPNLPGVSGRFITYTQLLSKAKTLLTVQATLAPGTSGGWSGKELLNAETDLLRANQDYAVLGIECDTICAGIALSGPDTGYQRCTVPGNAARSELTGGWFGLLSRMYDRALIPVINSGNRFSTYLECLTNENSITPSVSVNLVML